MTRPMTRCALIVLAGLVLSACASPCHRPVSAQMQPTDPAIIAKVKAERESVTKLYVVCQARAAKKLDDHKSDPATIAQAALA